MSTTIKVRDLLRGCTAGRLQSVGNMQVVPLCSELEDDRFVPATEAMVSTASPGTSFSVATTLGITPNAFWWQCPCTSARV